MAKFQEDQERKTTMANRTFHETTITIRVLSEDRVECDDMDDVRSIIREMDFGDTRRIGLKRVSHCSHTDLDEVRSILEEMGAPASFFSLDEPFEDEGEDESFFNMEEGEDC